MTLTQISLVIIIGCIYPARIKIEHYMIPNSLDYRPDWIQCAI
jgi:hypothetical protein